MTHHVPMTSGGLGSWLTARHAAESMQPGDRITLLFADVKGSQRCPECDGTGVDLDTDEGDTCTTCAGTMRVPASPHVGEDEDTYRFLRESSADVLALIPDDCTGQLVTVSDGRDIWQVFHDDRFLGNSRLANCSKLLKQRPCREWLEAHTDPADTYVYVGIDWSETHRLPAIERGWDPWPVRAPLTEPPHLDRDAMQALCRDAGMEVPRLYRAGFAHNNCGGFCVRAGQAQMELLLREHPDRYAFHEAEEQKLRDHLGKDVAVLRNRSNVPGSPDNSRPLTLRAFRERIEDQPNLFDPLDVGGCGCFTEDTTR